MNLSMNFLSRWRFCSGLPVVDHSDAPSLHQSPTVPLPNHKLSTCQSFLTTSRRWPHAPETVDLYTPASVLLGLPLFLTEVTTAPLASTERVRDDTSLAHFTLSLMFSLFAPTFWTLLGSHVKPCTILACAFLCLPPCDRLRTYFHMSKSLFCTQPPSRNNFLATLSVLSLKKTCPQAKLFSLTKSSFSSSSPRLNATNTLKIGVHFLWCVQPQYWHLRPFSFQFVSVRSIPHIFCSRTEERPASSLKSFCIPRTSLEFEVQFKESPFLCPIDVIAHRHEDNSSSKVLWILCVEFPDLLGSLRESLPTWILGKYSTRTQLGSLSIPNNSVYSFGLLKVLDLAFPFIIRFGMIMWSCIFSRHKTESE